MKHQLTIFPNTRTGEHQVRLVGKRFKVSRRILLVKVILHRAKPWSTLPWMLQMMEVYRGSRGVLVSLKKRNKIVIKYTEATSALRNHWAKGGCWRVFKSPVIISCLLCARHQVRTDTVLDEFLPWANGHFYILLSQSALGLNKPRSSIKAGTQSIFANLQVAQGHLKC